MQKTKGTTRGGCVTDTGHCDRNEDFQETTNSEYVKEFTLISTIMLLLILVKVTYLVGRVVALFNWPEVNK